jgi:hypothetical protein
MTLFAIGALLGLASCVTNPALTPAPAPSAAGLAGTWAVSLYLAPQAPTRSAAMVITAMNGDAPQGSFYGALIQEGRITRRNGAVVFAGVTADQSGFYSYSGQLSGNCVTEGQTLSEGRDFLIAWSAERQ